ncbi:MAG: hypothetical protein LUE99_08950 [Bacteroides sp.]|nr:hypothetical protein [Bacteroides sp.]
MKTPTRHLLILLLLIQTVCAHGYNLRQFSNIDGLSNSAVLSLYQDKEDFSGWELAMD